MDDVQPTDMIPVTGDALQRLALDAGCTLVRIGRKHLDPGTGNAPCCDVVALLLVRGRGVVARGQRAIRLAACFFHAVVFVGALLG